MPESLETDILNAKEYLNSQYVKIHDEWVSGCVQFFREEQRSKPYTRQQLNEMVKSQWLLGDLQEISPGCLPPNLNSQIKSSLNGVYLLQLISLLDIGLPAYQQLQKLTKIDNTNIEVTNKSNNNFNSTFQEPPSQRMLKLRLTDGVQEIAGIEYKSMRNLNTDLTPGVKIQVKGPVDCRRGVLMLEEKHITVLGGEVDDLLLVNQYSEVLTRIVESNARQNSELTETFTRQAYRPHVNLSSLNLQNQISNRNLNLKPNKQSIRSTTSLTNHANPIETAEFSGLNAEMFMDEDIDLDQIEALEEKVICPSNNYSSDCATPIMPSKKIKIDNSGQSVVPIPLQLHDDEINKPNFIEKPQKSTVYLDDEEEFERMVDIDEFNDYYNEPPVAVKPNVSDATKKSNMAEMITIQETESPVKVSHTPYVYLKQLSEISDERKLHKTFPVKAQIMKLNSKLSLQNHRWVLQCRLCDGSAYLDVEVSSQVLCQMVGYTPAEMTKMKGEMASNPPLKEKMLQGINNARQKIQKLDCLLLIAYSSTGPTIVGTEDFQFAHLRQLKTRHTHQK